MHYFAIILVFLTATELYLNSNAGGRVDRIQSAQAQVLSPLPSKNGALDTEWLTLVSNGASTANVLLRRIPELMIR